MRTVIEGPDKTGKSTLTAVRAEDLGIQASRLPSGWYREKLLSSEVNGVAGFFLFCSETAAFWENPEEELILDRDILSMIVYQGILQQLVNPMVIINLYKILIYDKHMPDEIIYLVNDPFEEYDMDDKFEAFGYEAIRAGYEEAFRLVQLNFPEITCKRLFIEDVNK